MIPPEGFAEHLLLLKSRMERHGGLRELRAWIDGWESHRMHGGGHDPEGGYFFSHFQNFVRESYPEAGLKSWDDIVAEKGGGDREGVSLFFELFEKFGPAKQARERLAEKSSYGPGKVRREAAPGVPDQAPRPVPPPPEPDPSLDEIITGFIEKPKTRPGDGSVGALQIYLKGWEKASPRARAGWQARHFTPWLQYHADTRETWDWTALVAPLTQEGEDPYLALRRALRALHERERAVGGKYNGEFGAPVIPRDGDTRGMPNLRVARSNTDE
ncbi:hypothetical protein [Oceanicola sp. 502str15]|uniref:hypothetical protein n=1 Tax=Oceanicola sp. 502str15 TaxID=2696061 RepID=UPI0020948BE8|nr:hypothetical protein [Oceanicola sp. 502str15]MCO6381209.1 hypothetical protein [Oceanicola sp. 502str15]